MIWIHNPRASCSSKQFNLGRNFGLETRVINDRSFSFHRWSFDEYSMDSGTSLTPRLPTLSYLLAFLVNYCVPTRRSITRVRTFLKPYISNVASIFSTVIFTYFTLCILIYITNCEFVTIVKLLIYIYGYYLRCYLLLYQR